MDSSIKTTQFKGKIMKKSNYLDKILIRKKHEIMNLTQMVKNDPKHLYNEILSQTYAPSTKFSKALKGTSLGVIAEVKRRSPSLGEIRNIADPSELALQYCRGGASAISVLTDAEGFGGSLLDIRQVVQARALQYPNVAILRKDFILHPLQLAEAVHVGANAVLLISQAVGKSLRSLIQEAHRLGLETLTEVHDLAGLELALEAEAPILGINHRNLETFEMNMNISEILKPLIPPHIITVAESGIHEQKQAKRMRELGFDAILVGEALVRSNIPEILIGQMKGESNES